MSSRTDRELGTRLTARRTRANGNGESDTARGNALGWTENAIRATGTRTLCRVSSKFHKEDCSTVSSCHFHCKRRILTIVCFPGQGQYTFSNGDTYVGQYVKGFIAGPGMMLFKDGTKYVGQWKQNQPQGEGVLTDKEGVRYKQVWKNGKCTSEDVQDVRKLRKK